MRGRVKRVEAIRARGQVVRRALRGVLQAGRPRDGVRDGVHVAAERQGAPRQA